MYEPPFAAESRASRGKVASTHHSTLVILTYSYFGQLAKKRGITSTTDNYL